MFNNLKKYQPDVVQFINNIFARERLVHTYLFHGPRGSLKRRGAYYFAAKVLGKCGGCGACEFCEALERNFNIFEIRPEDNTIKKEQIEDLIHEFMMTSDSPRVFIIEDIDKATPSAANSLLKFLEEMPGNRYGILTTEHLNQVLPTIISRSQVVRFNPLTENIISDTLINEGVHPEKAKVIATLTGDRDVAQELVKDPKIDEIVGLVEAIHESILDYEKDPLLVYCQGSAILDDRNREYHEYFVSLLITLQEEKLKMILTDVPSTVFETWFAHQPLGLSKATEIAILEALLKLQDRLPTNINKRLAYLDCLTALGRIRYEN